MGPSTTNAWTKKFVKYADRVDIVSGSEKVLFRENIGSYTVCSENGPFQRSNPC